MSREYDEGVEVNNGGPVLQGSNIRYELADRARAIACGGIGAIHRIVQKLGLPKRLRQLARQVKDVVRINVLGVQETPADRHVLIERATKLTSNSNRETQRARLRTRQKRPRTPMAAKLPSRSNNSTHQASSAAPDGLVRFGVTHLRTRHARINDSRSWSTR